MSKLLINEVPLVCLSGLAVKIGLNEALFIQQLHYWVDHSKNIIEGRQWVYNTMADWSKQFPFWSQKTLSRTISSLEKQGLVISGNYNQKGYDRTKWYTIDYDAFEQLEKDAHETEKNGGNKEKLSRENDSTVSDQSIGTNCLYPSGQVVPMESDKLSSPIPENSNREFSEKTTTNRQDENVVCRNTVNIKKSLDRLLFAMPSYGISITTARKFITEYGLSAVEKQFELFKKALQKGNINNPAGWLYMALREGYIDTPTVFKQFQEEKKVAMREKAAEIKRHQMAALERELEEKTKQFEISKNSPFQAFVAKLKKAQAEKIRCK